VSLDDIVVGLEHATGAKGRLNFIQHKDYLFIDDTYNANPTSMRAAADVLAQQDGIKVMVIGDIGELGSSAAQQHYMLGRDLVHTLVFNLSLLSVSFHLLCKKARAVHNMVKNYRPFLLKNRLYRY
jgi:UDP-N-acetylmuramyl pentapeptide synthase